MRFLKLALMSVTMFLFTAVAYAADAAPSGDIFSQVMGFLAPVISGLAQSHPVIITILAAIGTARLIFKAIFSFAHAIADATVTPKDNEAIDKVEKSGAFKTVSFILDYLFSIKIEKPKA